MVEADARLPRGVAWLPFNQPDAAAGTLIDSTASVIDLHVENL
jgi:hypothetical protein